MSDHDIMEAGGVSRAEVHHSMQAAWMELAEMFFADLPRRQRQDAKFIFFNGVRCAANLMILAAGSGKLEGAIDSIVKEIMDYEKEARAMLGERLDGLIDESGAVN